ncbi:MAG: ATP-binding protein [Epsilonproteobacteria bacterium]|nr:ATP-binding protein [Campylobacterota bacterium]
MDREEIINILKDWNFWESEPKDTFDRDFYDRDIIKKASAKEILFIKGIRRSGKSTLLINYIKHLLKNGVSRERILFVNLEDPRFATNLSLKLLEDIKLSYIYYLNPSDKPYIFLDEVQNIDGFEKWLLKEYELNSAYLFATGSNSKLLSSEIGSSLSGRYLDVLVYPLSFKEFLTFKGIKIDTPYKLISQKVLVEKEFEEFLSFGGFPKVVLTKEKELKRAELKSYFDSILLRDIVARYNLDNFRVLESLAIYLLSSISNPISINKIKNHLKISYDMANRYFEYLQNAFIIDALSLFDWSYKKQLVNPKKIYSIDLGLTKRVSFEVGKKKGDYLENIVFLELKRRFDEIYYYKTSQNYEVDFLVKDTNKITHLIQVSYTIKEKKTFDREIRALLKANSELSSKNQIELSLITYDNSKDIYEDNIKIKIINIFEWLLL